MTITTERAEELAEGMEILGLYSDARHIRALAKERDELIAANKLMADDLVDRHDRHCTVVEQLAAAQAVIAKKDEALSDALYAVRCHSHIADNSWWAKHIPSDDTALREMLAEQWEKAASLCEKSDRYRGDYFAALIRAEAEKLNNIKPQNESKP